MSVSRSAQCLVSRPFAPRAMRIPQQRDLHISASLMSRRRSRFQSISEEEVRRRLKAPKNADMSNFIKPYSNSENEALSKKYTREQIEVIQAGEQAIDANDLLQQAVPRRDMYKLPYLDDLSVLRPVLDRTPAEKLAAYDPEARLAEHEAETEEFRTQSRAKIAQLLDKGEDYINSPDMNEAEFEELQKFLSSKPTLSGKPTDFPFPTRYEEDFEDQSEFAKPSQAISLDGLPPSTLDGLFGSGSTARGKLASFNQEVRSARQDIALAPELPVIPELEGKFKTVTEDPNRDPDGHFGRLAKITGRSLEELLGVNSKVLVRRFVSNQTRLGKIRSCYSLAIAGDGKGMLGIGSGKSAEAPDATVKARLAALRNMRPVPRYEGRTIFGDQEAKVGAVNVQLFTKPPGYGLRCQHLIYELARAAGISDLGARVPNARNKMNTVKAAYEALMNQKLPEDIAWGRGKKMVDVRKVYYSGSQRTRLSYNKQEAGDESRAENSVKAAMRS